jgi:hypothetical protein
MKQCLIVAMLVLIPSAASAQSGAQVAILGCQNAAVKELRKLSPGSDNIRFAPNPQVTEKSKKEATVSGGGQFTDGSSRQPRRFTYDCTYGTRSAETRATVRLEGNSNSSVPRSPD